MSLKTSIGWTDATWNPIKGLCKGGCWYCYSRKMVKRFKWNETLRLQLDEYKLKKIPDGSRVFVCSMVDLFHHEVKPAWRAKVFEIIEKYPKLTFQILTKYPRNVGGGALLGNVWLGISLTGKPNSAGNWQRFKDFQRTWAALKFISFEPMMSKSFYPLEDIDWVIIGALTGHGNKLQPKRAWIKSYVDRCKVLGIPIFLKNNLKDIWRAPLIQQFPYEPIVYEAEGLPSQEEMREPDGEFISEKEMLEADDIENYLEPEDIPIKPKEEEKNETDKN